MTAGHAGSGAQSGTRTFYIGVNGGPGIALPMTGSSWSTPTSASVVLPLVEGTNTLSFYNDADGAPDLDRIVVL